jgi:hypothetical protein
VRNAAMGPLGAAASSLATSAGVQYHEFLGKLRQYSMRYAGHCAARVHGQWNLLMTDDARLREREEAGKTK